MNKHKILGIGLSGLVGSRVEQLLQNRYEFEFVSRSSGIDITNKELIYHEIKKSDASVVFHLAAKADVDGCERDHEEDSKILGYKDIEEQEKEWKEKQTAWAINVMGTQNVVSACEQTGKKIIYVSTDFVFSGDDAPLNGYTEDDKPNPIDWYGRTKYEGENRVKQSKIPWAIMRLAYPYRSDFVKKDFIRFIIERLSANQKLSMITDHIICPTFIDDFATIFDVLIEKELTGIFHTVGNQAISPYEAARLVAKVFGFEEDLIATTTRDEFFHGRAKRPFNLTLKNAKIETLGIMTKSLEEGLIQVKDQMRV